MKVEKENSCGNAAGAAVGGTARHVQPRGKPDNYWELCQALQAQDDNDFDDFESEMQSLDLAPSSAAAQSQLEHRTTVASKAIERERQNRSHEELLLGEQELPGVLRSLARVFDFQNCQLLDKPREAAVKPLATVAQPQPPRLREVPVVPPELDTMMVEPISHMQQQQPQQQHKQPPQQLQQQQWHFSQPQLYPHYPPAHYLPPLHRPAPQHPAHQHHHHHHLASRRMDFMRFGPEQNFRCMPPPGLEFGFPQHMFRFHRPPLKQRQPPYIPPHRQLSHRQPLYAPPQRPPPGCVRPPNPRKPIIVVPEELASLVTLHNVQPLLQELRFVPPAALRRSELRLLEEVNVVRTCRGEEQHFRVVDNVARLTREDWDQVVAVFVFNPHQQFNGWPAHADAAAICRQLCAFHLHYRGRPIYRDLEPLWLNVLSIPEHDRKLDAEILLEFWHKLDQHMASDRQFGLGRVAK